MLAFQTKLLQFHAVWIGTHPMLEHLRQQIGIRLAKLYSWRKKTPVTDFTRLYSTARSALVIAPLDEQHREAAIPVLTSLQSKFRGNKLTIVVLDSFRNISSSVAHCNVFFLREEDMDLFFLPKKKTMVSLFEQRFDLAVDLNFHLIPSAAYICRGVNAGLRVGFAKEDGDWFYNFQFRSASQKNPEMQYTQLLRTLAMF